MMIATFVVFLSLTEKQKRAARSGAIPHFKWPMTSAQKPIAAPTLKSHGGVMSKDKSVHVSGNIENEADPKTLVLGAICMAPLAIAGACLLFLT
jgi:hypothetical protein